MRNQAYGLFRRRIHRKARVRRFPLRVMFELTYRCNFKCLHCYIPESYRIESDKKELKTQDVFFILDQLRDIGCLYLGFTGGEPFVRKDFLDILHYAKTKGFEVIVYTNGSFIGQGLAKVLKKIKLNKIDITLNSLRKGPFERITRKPGSYEKVFRGIELLYKNNIPLGFKSCLLSENQDEIVNIQEFVRSHHAQHRLDTILMPRLDGSKEPYKYRARLDGVTGEHSKTKFNQGGCDLSRRAKKRLTASDLFLNCGIGISQAAITPYGELKLCLMMEYPKYQILDREDTKSQGSAEGGPAYGGHQVTKTKNSLKIAWEKLKGFVTQLKPSTNFQSYNRNFAYYNKPCLARAWLEGDRLKEYFAECKEWAE